MSHRLLYPTAKSWLDAPAKRVALIGMSGLGKTYISSMLREGGDWFHYSVDYRIGTRYMGEHIVDNFKKEAMKIPFLRELLLDDAIYIASNITFHNLAPLSTYLGKPGDTAKGGIPFAEYMRRQDQHRDAEIASTIDAVDFVEKAERIYGYGNFVCDTSGSICEVVNPSDPDDPVLTALASNMLIVWIRGADSHIETLARRFDKAPKPMYARAPAMEARWTAYLGETGHAEAAVDPDAFIRWSYRKIIEDRVPLYAAIAENWGVTIDADAMAQVASAADFVDLIGTALPA